MLYVLESDDYGEGLTYLYKEHRKTLFNYSLGILGSPSDAEDCVADTFEAVHRLLLKSPSKIDSWESKRTRNLLITIARNRARSMLRRKNNIDFVALSESFSDDYNAVLSSLSIQQAKGLLGDAIQELDEKYKTPLVLRYYHDLSVSEIAQVLDISENNVSARLHRARTALKKGLVDCHEE